MNCPKCGYLCADNAKFCIKCGYHLEEYLPSSDPIEDFFVSKDDINSVRTETLSFGLFGRGLDIQNEWIILEPQFLLFDKIKSIIQSSNIETYIFNKAKITYNNQVRDFDSFYCGATINIFKNALLSMAKACYYFLPALDIYNYSVEQAIGTLIENGGVNSFGFLSAFEQAVGKTHNGNYQSYLDQQQRANNLYWGGLLLGGWTGVAVTAVGAAQSHTYVSGLTQNQKSYLFNQIDHNNLLNALRLDLHYMYIELARMIRNAGVDIYIPSKTPNQEISNIMNNAQLYNLVGDALKNQVVKMFGINPYDKRVPQSIINIRLKEGTITKEQWEIDKIEKKDNLDSMAHYIQGL